MTGRIAIAFVAGVVCFRPEITIGQTTPAAAGDTVRVFSIDPAVPLDAPPPNQGVGSGLFDGFYGVNYANTISSGPLTLVLGAQDGKGVAPLTLQSNVVIAIDYRDSGCVCLKLLADGSIGSVACQGGVAYGTSIVTSGDGSWTAQTHQLPASGNGNGDLVVMGLVSQPNPDQPCDLVDCNTVDYPNPPNELPFTTASASAAFQGGTPFSTSGAPFDCANFGAPGSGGALVSGIALKRLGNIPTINTLRLSNAEPDLTPTNTAPVPSPTNAPPTPTDTPPIATTNTPIPTNTPVPAGARVHIDIGSAEGMPGETVTFSVGITVAPVTSTLETAISATDTAIRLTALDNFPSVPLMSHAPIGTIRIDNELISYTGISDNSLIGVTRGFGTFAAACTGNTPPVGCPAAHNLGAEVILEGPVGIENEIGFLLDAPIVEDPNKPFRPACTGAGGSFTFQPANCTVGMGCATVLAQVLTGVEIPTGSTVYTCSVAISPSAMGGQAFPLSCSGGGLIAASSKDSAYVPLATTCTDGQIVVPEPTAVSTPTDTMTSPPSTDTPTAPPGATATETETSVSPTMGTEMPTSTVTSTPAQTTTGSPASPTETPTGGGVATATKTIVSPTAATGVPTSTKTQSVPLTPTATTHAVGTPTPTRSATGTAEVALTPTVTATASLVACVGDCHGIGTVAIGDVITLVNILLGNVDASTCSKGIPPGVQIDIALIIRAVNSVLNGCSA